MGRFLFAESALYIFLNKFRCAFGTKMCSVNTKVIGVNLAPFTLTVAVVVVLTDTVVTVHLLYCGGAVKRKLLHNAVYSVFAVALYEYRDYTVIIL